MVSFDGRRTLEAMVRTIATSLVAVPCAVFEEHGAELFRLADGLGLEGIVAKRRDAPYPRTGRSKDWVKVKTAHGRRIDEERAKWNER